MTCRRISTLMCRYVTESLSLGLAWRLDCCSVFRFIPLHHYFWTWSRILIGATTFASIMTVRPKCCMYNALIFTRYACILCSYRLSVLTFLAVCCPHSYTQRLRKAHDHDEKLAFLFELSLPRVSVSIIDAMPQEVLFLTLEHISCMYTSSDLYRKVHKTSNSFIFK